MPHKRWVKILRAFGFVVVGGFLIAQLIPYGRDHKNPPAVAEPSWDSSETRALARRACFDCHSNETRWPWYSNVAPVSWLAQGHVDEGRRKLNFSEWNRPFEEANEAGQTVRDESMPPSSYLILHPEARLSSAERQLLARGLDSTIGGAESPGEDD